MAHNRADNCLLLRDGDSYLLLGHIVNSALILRDVQGVGGLGISGGTFSRGRWRALKEEEQRKIEAARIAEERAEAKRQAEIVAQKAAAQEATRRRRFGEDLDWALRSQVSHRANAQATMDGAQRMARVMHETSLKDAAARRAHLARQQQEDDEAAIERLLLDS